VFDLSRCGDTDKYLSISTGYRKAKKPENANKVEIWFVPRFLIEKELKTTAKHFQAIFGNWKETAEVGIFWSWGEYDDLSWYDYWTTEYIENLSKINLYENWKKSGCARGVSLGFSGRLCLVVRAKVSLIRYFHVHFLI